MSIENNARTMGVIVLVVLIKLCCLGLRCYCYCRDRKTAREPARRNPFAIPMPAPPPREVVVDPVIRAPTAPSEMPYNGYPYNPCSPPYTSGPNLTAPTVTGPKAVPLLAEHR